MHYKIDMRALETAAVGHGLKFVCHTPYHFKVIGHLIVNVYPTSGTVHIIGMCKGIYFESVDKIVLAAKGEYAYRPAEKVTRPSSKSMNAKRKKLWNLGQRNCALCTKPFRDITDATVDHRIPLSKGGTNLLDNLQLAHRDCNQDKGSHLKLPPKPEPQQSKITLEEVADIIAARYGGNAAQYRGRRPTFLVDEEIAPLRTRTSANVVMKVGQVLPHTEMKVEQNTPLLARVFNRIMVFLKGE